MRRRKWDPKTKALIVLQGLKGKPLADLCAEHQISQAQYYQWRDQFLANAHTAFEIAAKDHREVYLEKHITRLNTMVGELTMELKKSDEAF
jgi:transposase-like protein